MAQLDKKYDPKKVDVKWYKFWEESGFFAAHADSEKKPYCICIPPPNITGILHMGHALTNTLQDVLIRYKRMSGYEAVWVPGVKRIIKSADDSVDNSKREKEKKEPRYIFPASKRWANCHGVPDKKNGCYAEN